MALDPKSLVNDSTKIGTLPQVFYEINEAIEDPEASFSRIATIISADGALSARLLKIVNSSFYAFTSKVETITHAITIVGLAQLRELVLATTVISQFKGVSKDVVDMQAFWGHSIACGLAARIIAIYKREHNAERFYVMGILHDIGRLVFLLNVPDEMKKAFAIYEKGGLLHEAEKEIFGFDHTETGHALVQKWQLHETMAEAVLSHHNPSVEGDESTSAGILHLADIVSHALQLGGSGERFVPPLDEKVWKELGLPVTLLSSIITQVDRQYEEAVQMFQS
ncbi:MAG: HDOD domain-containing protein [Candidatus Nitrohelix vancouverensis]|uniref:HDOD domain-containing protein n=1 Tax=Candidatus Nitrohelix vancouverensis TaxID=2705534 RepID=A0A7T0C2Z4_9BACT|nr:MAG: HDOD domain-containing protein [Candidatus Nitrohelix vancouverensis]